MSSLPIAGIGRRGQVLGDGAQEERALSRGLGASGSIKAEAPARCLRGPTDDRTKRSALQQEHPQPLCQEPQVPHASST